MLNSNALGYVVEGDANEAKFCSIIRQSTKETAILAEVFESCGILRLVNMFPLVVNDSCQKAK